MIKTYKDVYAAVKEIYDMKPHSEFGCQIISETIKDGFHETEKQMKSEYPNGQKIKTVKSEYWIWKTEEKQNKKSKLN